MSKRLSALTYLIIFTIALISNATPAFASQTLNDPTAYNDVEPDTEPEIEPDNNTDSDAERNTPYDKKTAESHNWWQLLKKGKLNIADTTVVYPRFLRFCVNVYNWADRVFNSYDPDYVVGTGRRWKARVTSDNWVDSYYLDIDKKMPMRMMSDMYSNAGAYIQYMAVSLGYSVDINNVFGNEKSHHKKTELNFNCARFNIEAHYWENTGGTYIRTFGKYDDGHLIKRAFPGARQKTFGVNGYYFFNNRKFAMGAAYNFSKFQKRSAGSAIIGFNYNNLDISMNMNQLTDDLKPYLTIDPQTYRFHYNTYCLMGGYSFNWVWNPHFLFNISAFPGIGYTQCYEDSTEKGNGLFAITLKGQGSLTYNLGDFFVCAIAKLDGNWYNSHKLSLFSSVENAQLSVGFRF